MLFRSIDVNTLGFYEIINGTIKHGQGIYGAGTGTGHIITPQFSYENTTSLGANSQPTKSNQVVLGDANVTEVAMGNGDVIYPTLNVTKVGTPANNQIGVWTGDGTIEGDSYFEYSSVNQTLKITDDADFLVSAEMTPGSISIKDINIDEIMYISSGNLSYNNTLGDTTLSFNTSGTNTVTVPATKGTMASISNVAPSSASDTGVVGEIRVTATYVYYCIATDTWVRSVAATW